MLPTTKCPWFPLKSIDTTSHTMLQVDRLHSEKACLQKEKSELQRTVTELGSSIDKMHRDKVALESQMEMEEEGIVNRLNRYAWSLQDLGSENN
jgi:uncharacterized protein YlxW (UPF0749 family)